MSTFHELGARNFESSKSSGPYKDLDFVGQARYRDKLTQTQMSYSQSNEFYNGFMEAQGIFLRPYAQAYYKELDILHSRFTVDNSAYDDSNDHCSMKIGGYVYRISRELLA